MEPITLVLNNGDAFDKAVHGKVPEKGDLAMTSKAYATTGGKPAVAITFTAVVDGVEVPVQAVTTLALLSMAVRAISAAHERD